MDSSHHLHLTSNFSGMGGADEGSSSGRRSREIENLSLEISKYPRDLLQTFMVRNPQRIVRVKEEEEDEGVELHLGLSLGGKFGVDKSHMGLLRSSSIAGSLPLIREDDPVVQPPPLVAPPPLARAASLPFDTEEEWRKRKELQTFRRMEAKKRRSEKQRNMKGCGEGRGGSGGGSEAGLISGEKLEKLQHCTRVFKSACLPNVAGAACSANQSAVDDVEKGKRSFFSSLQGLLAQQGSQGSAESQGCGSSGPSESDSRPTQGSSSEAKSPVARTTNDIGSGMEDTRKQAVTGGGNAKKRETGTNLEDIPCVFTIGDGPNGRKVDGILYKYGKGEDVRIMCVCHGGFFSPAEFVKHAGGCDVEHPLRHIVVDPSCSAFR